MTRKDVWPTNSGGGRGGRVCVGWVNLYHKFEIEKFAVCGKLILPKK